MHGEYDVVRLESVDTARILPARFWDAVINRYFPVLGFTFIATVAGVAFKQGGAAGFARYFLGYKEAYEVALAVALWVSIPAVLWILLKTSRMTAAFANSWYIVTTLMMVATLLATVLLFPEAEGGMKLVRMFIVAALPMHVLQYGLLVRRGLPRAAAASLNLLGLSMLVYGFVVLR